jgi:hypothetical protein
LFAKNANEIKQIRQKVTSFYFFGTPQPLLSIPEPGFQQFHTSSWTHEYCQKPQSPDSVKDFPKEYPRNSYLCHLKYHVTRMANHLGSYLDELVPDRPCRAFVRGVPTSRIDSILKTGRNKTPNIVQGLAA